MRGLFGRLLAVMCGVAAASMALVLVLQERSLSQDLEQAAEQRLEAAARAADRLAARHLQALRERYRAVSGTPQLRATLEVNDGPTLAHYAESLRLRQGADRIAFVDAQGQLAAGAGEAALDAAALGVAGEGLVDHAGRPYAVVTVDLARSGRLVAVEAIDEATLADWSELCGARVSFRAAEDGAAGELVRVVRPVGALALRVASSLAAERTAMANARRSLLAAGALGLALAFLVSLAVSRGLVRPIQHIQGAARRIGAGDLSLRIDATRRDEIGDVARSFDDMSRQLSATIRSVVEAADLIEHTAGGIGEGTRGLLRVAEVHRHESEKAAATLGAIQERVQSIAGAAGESARRLATSVDGSSMSFRQLAAAGEQLEQNAATLGLRSEEITASIQQVAAGAEQVAGDTESLLPAVDAAVGRVAAMADAAGQVNRHVDETLQLSANVVRSAEQGDGVVRDAVAGMESTRDTIRESERVIEALRERVEQIGKIVEMIDAVADETSLLALNGSIIAAQSGEHGRAFSVVAEQLRSLATRVRDGTREIDEVVCAVQTETGNAVASIGRGSERAEAGTALIRNAQDALSAIAQAAQQSKDRMKQSVAATVEQMTLAATVADEMEGVRAGVDRIRNVTREQAQAAGVVTVSAGELYEVAQQVQHNVASQTQGAAAIGEGVEGVQRAVREITCGLEEQAAASDEVATVVRASDRHTEAQEHAAREIERAADELAARARALRDAVARFSIAR